MELHKEEERICKDLGDLNGLQVPQPGAHPQGWADRRAMTC